MILNDEETAIEAHGADRIEIALPGRELPRLTLNSTTGPVVLRELGRELLVLFIYPHASGLPDAPVPGWDSIPGARGCTAQACAFRDHQAKLSELGVQLAGLSVQTVNEQREFALRVGTDYRLISDRELLLAAALGLPTFGAGGRTFYRRVTIVAEKGAIARVFYPVVAPEQNADEIVAWLESRPAQPPSDDIES